MAIVSVRIPQLGEGLHEAILVRFLKQPGDAVRKDEPIYEMETDKAVTEVESPYVGKIVEWSVTEGTVLTIGEVVGKMEVAEGVKEMSAGHGVPPAAAASSHSNPSSTSIPPTTSNFSAPVLNPIAAAAKPVPAAVQAVQNTPRFLPHVEMTSGTSKVVSNRSRTGVLIPPKTRKYLNDLALWDYVDQIPCPSGKLMPEHVDAYLITHPDIRQLENPGYDQIPVQEESRVAPRREVEPKVTEPHRDEPVSKSQLVLNYRLVRGAQQCVPATIMAEVDWTGLEQARAQAKAVDGPTAFQMLLWCVVQALRRHDKFRSSLVDNGKTLRTYDHVNLGIAVSLPHDMLVTAVIHRADLLSREEFWSTARARIEEARQGKDQAEATTTMSVSNVGMAGIRIGIPAIVSPAVATLALGETYWAPIPKEDGGFEFRKSAMLTLTFDHRIVNGIGAGSFLADIRQEIQAFRW